MKLRVSHMPQSPILNDVLCFILLFCRMVTRVRSSIPNQSSVTNGSNNQSKRLYVSFVFVSTISKTQTSRSKNRTLRDALFVCLFVCRHHFEGLRYTLYGILLYKQSKSFLLVQATTTAASHQ